MDQRSIPPEQPFPFPTASGSLQARVLRTSVSRQRSPRSIYPNFGLRKQSSGKELFLHSASRMGSTSHRDRSAGEVSSFRRHDVDFVITFLGGGECELAAIGRKTRVLKRTASRSQTAGETTLKRYFPKVILAGENNLILENCRKTEIAPGHWFSKLRIWWSGWQLCQEAKRKQWRSAPAQP